MYYEDLSFFSFLHFYDDLVRVAGVPWIRVAQDRSIRRTLGEAYVPQWSDLAIESPLTTQDNDVNKIFDNNDSDTIPLRPPPILEPTHPVEIPLIVSAYILL